MTAIVRGVFAGLVLLAGLPAEAAPGAANEPVALVYALKGEAQIDPPGAARRTLRLFDRLAVGATLELGAGARLSLAFASGRRYELSELSRAAIGERDLASRAGPVRRLADVPPLPVIAPIAEAGRPGHSAGAVRVRAERLRGLYPRRGVATLAAATLLRFEPASKANRYRIEVRDPRGRLVHESETAVPALRLPPGALAAGMSYAWSVRTVERAGPLARGEAEFVTLPAQAAAEREALRAAVEVLADRDARALLAEVDKSLGLLAEARDGLREAVRASPGDAGLGAALAELERWLAEGDTEGEPGSIALGLAALAIAAVGGGGGTGAVAAEWAGQPVEELRCPRSAPGVVVEEVPPETAGALAGVRAGDRLLSWCRTTAEPDGCVQRGELRSPFEWLEVELEEVQRGGFVLMGLRGGEGLRWHLPRALLGLTVAPSLSGALAAAVEASREKAKAGDSAGAALDIERAAELAAAQGCTLEELWLRERAARLHASARRGPEADSAYQLALGRALALGGPWIEVQLRMGWWGALWVRGEFARARKEAERALSRVEASRPGGLVEAWVLLRLASVAERQDELEEAERLLRRAYDLAVRLAPGSGAEASLANNLGAVLVQRGDLAQSEPYLERALAVHTELGLSNRGAVMPLWNYGGLLSERGDLAGAEAAFLRAKRILEELRPDSQPLATTLHELGRVAAQRGDRAAAESLLRRELRLIERAEPNDSQAFERLAGLGGLALLQRNGPWAEEVWRRCLAVSERLNPGGPKCAACLLGLAEALALQDRRAEALGFLRRSLAIWDRLNPEASSPGTAHFQLGALLLEEGDLDAAERHLQRAIAIQQRFREVVPERHQALARVLARAGRVEEAAAAYSAAIDALESLGTRLGGPRESRWLHRSPLGDLHLEAAELQISLGRLTEAWELVERGRARGLRDLVAERDLRFGADLPAELYAERNRLAAEYDRAHAALAAWEPAQGQEELEALEGRLRDLRLEQGQIHERTLSALPPLAAFTSPAPLGVSDLRLALDPGTVLLTYAVGEAQSYLFVVGAADGGPQLYLFPVPAGRKELEREVDAMRSLLITPESSVAAIQQRGRELYDLLVRPAEPLLEAADRWLVSPNGPLWALPFGTLFSDGRYLVESRRIHLTGSAGEYRALQHRRGSEPAPGATELLAVGDPQYPAVTEGPEDSEDLAVSAASAQVPSTLRRGLSLRPLPATRREVGEISALFPSARVLLGGEATEEAVKSLAPRARRIHFACHGLLDERFPLNSALALSIPRRPEPGRDNGLLQAWEIFDGMRLEAELVTLSACESALGPEMGGEGLVGLARAFQFAGARSVVASWWSVADSSTEALMRHFYGRIRAGVDKDEALRAAQSELVRSPAMSHPYFWAAFQLFGDWR